MEMCLFYFNCFIVKPKGVSIVFYFDFSQSDVQNGVCNCLERSRVVLQNLCASACNPQKDV